MKPRQALSTTMAESPAEGYSHDSTCAGVGAGPCAHPPRRFSGCPRRDQVGRSDAVARSPGQPHRSESMLLGSGSEAPRGLSTGSGRSGLLRKGVPPIRRLISICFRIDRAPAGGGGAEFHFFHLGHRRSGVPSARSALLASTGTPVGRETLETAPGWAQVTPLRMAHGKPYRSGQWLLLRPLQRPVPRDPKPVVTGPVLEPEASRLSRPQPGCACAIRGTAAPWHRRTADHAAPVRRP